MVSVDEKPNVSFQAAASLGTDRRTGSNLAPRSFLSHTLVTASAGGRHLVRGCYGLTTSSRRLGGDMGAAKPFLSPLEGHDEDTANG